MAPNDVIAVNTEYTNWLALRAAGLAEFDPEIAPFEFFCAEQFLKSHILLTDEDILSGVVGKSNDGGVDSFYFIVNGQLVKEDTHLPSQAQQAAHLVFIQSKENKGFAPNSVDKFETFTDDLLDLGKTPEQYGRKYHIKLLDMMRTFKIKYRQLSMPQTTIDYYYVTKADAIENEGCERSAERVIAMAKKHFPGAKIHPFHFINAARFYTQMQLRQPTTKDLRFVEWVDSPEGWIGLVTLSEFHNFLHEGSGQRDDRMFDDNVRGFYRETSVNRSIYETLTNPVQMPEFWLLNNGVTVLSSKVQPKSYRLLEITDPQIVNGLQTSRQILAYFGAEAIPADDKRRILVRVIQNSTEDVRDKIIRATNNQNPMPAESLFTTFRIHKQIELIFEKNGLYYERRKGFYRDQRKPISQIVSSQELIQAVVAVMTDRQDDARGRPKDYIVDETKRWAMFGHDDYDDSHIMTDLEVVSKPPFEIKVYLNCVRLVRRVDKFLARRQLRLNAEDKRNIRFYLAKYVACEAAKSAYCPPSEVAKLDVDLISDDSMTEPFKRVRRLYRRHGGNDDAGRSPLLSAALNKMLIKEFSPPKKRTKS
jgi:hypothetical protein